MDDGRVVLTRHRLDVDEYYRMAEAGILGEDDRIELIDGELIDMAPIGQDHASSVNSLNEALVLAFTGRAIVSPQHPVRLDRFQ
jgi:Uma2 family endonuclease